MNSLNALVSISIPLVQNFRVVFGGGFLSRCFTGLGMAEHSNDVWVRQFSDDSNDVWVRAADVHVEHIYIYIYIYIYMLVLYQHNPFPLTLMVRAGTATCGPQFQWNNVGYRPGWR